MTVVPHDSVGLQVDGEDFVFVGTVERATVQDSRRGAGVGARRQREKLPAVANANASEDLVAAGDVGDAVDDGWRRVHIAVGLCLPLKLAGSGSKRIEIRV